MHLSGVLSAFFFVLATSPLTISGATADPASSLFPQELTVAPSDSSQPRLQFDSRPLRLVAYPRFIAENLTRLLALTGELAWLPRMKESLIWEDGAMHISPSLDLDGTFGLQMRRRSFLVKGSSLHFSLESGNSFDAADWRMRAQYRLQLDTALGWFLPAP